MEKSYKETNIIPKKKKKFLKNLSETGNITISARAIGWTRSNAYYHKNKDKEFSMQWDNAREEGADRLEAEAFRRAVEGINIPIFYKGEVKGVVKKYSDSLLIFLLKGARPEKYRDNHKIDMSVNHQSTQTLAEVLKRIDGNTTFNKLIKVNAETKSINIK